MLGRRHTNERKGTRFSRRQGSAPSAIFFFVVGWNDYATQLKEEFPKQLDAFGADLSTSGMVLQSYKASEYSTFDEIRGKKWPSEFLKRLQEDVNPCMLIIQRDFEAFCPDADRWAVVWFSDLANYAKDLPQLFHKPAQLSRSGCDVFDHLKRLALEHHGKKIAGLGRMAGVFRGEARDIRNFARCR